MILVTGGAGYIGSHIVDLLKDQKVIVLDDFSNADFAIVDKLNARRASRVTVVEGSINDASVLDYAFNRSGIKAVIHCAGLKSVAESNRKKAAYTRVNVHGTTDVMVAAINFGVKTFIFSSSASVYAPSQDGSDLTEDSLTGPISHYGLTKLEAEKAIFSLPKAHDSNIRVCALRYFNPIGAFPFRDRSPSNLVPALCNATYINSPLLVFGSDYPTPDGSCQRDYIPVDLLAQVHRAALTNKNFSGVVNVGTNSSQSVYQLHQLWMEATRTYIELSVQPPRPGDAPRLVANNAKLMGLIRGQRGSAADWVRSRLESWHYREASYLKQALASQYDAYKQSRKDSHYEDDL